MENISIVNLVWQKINFRGSPLGGPRKGHPQTISKYLSVKYLFLSKKHWHPSLSHLKKKFKRVHFGGFQGGVAPPNYVEIFVC